MPGRPAPAPLPAPARTEWESPEALAPRVQAAKEGHYRELTAGGIKAFAGAEALLRRALAAGMKVRG